MAHAATSLERASAGSEHASVPSSPPPRPSLTHRDMVRWSRIVAIALALVGVTGLVRWLAGAGPSQGALAGPSASGALAFLLAALSLWFSPAGRPGLGRLCGLLTAILGGSAFVTESLHHSAAINRLLFGGLAHVATLTLPAPMAPGTAFCLALAGLSLAFKRQWPRTGAGVDLFVVFVAFTTVLGRLLGAPAANAAQNPQMNLLAGLALLALSTASLMAYPEYRPVAYFVEDSSAGRMLRRLLPLTLAFPLMLILLQFAGRHGATAVSRWGALAFLSGVVVFWVALMWMVSSALDRVDSTHRSAEAALRASQERYRLLLEASSEGIVAIDMDGNCLWCNPAAAQLLGVPEPAALVGRNLHALAHHTRADGTPYPAEECSIRLAAERDGSDSGEDLFWRSDGTSFTGAFRSNPVRRDGRVEAIVVSFADITRKKVLEDQLRQAQKMDAVGRLAAGVAHDFNNLLTVINGYSEMLMEQELPGRVQEKLANIRKAGEKAAALTHQLLAFSRQQVLQLKVLDLNSVLADMEKLLLRVIGEDMQLEMMMAPDLAPVKADRGQLEQVLMNLAVNARDAMPNGGKLTIETSNVELDGAYAASHAGVTPGPHTMLAVTDSGLGMDKATMARIFEPFFTTKPQGKGTGLGLATVFGIVKQSGGHVGVYSEPGFGTTMKVYLPSAGGVRAVEESATVRATPQGSGTVLVVEDEKELGEFLQEVLEGQGYTVLRSDHGEQAIAISREHGGTIDLVLSDVVLPGMNGRQVVEQICQVRPGVRVLFISGYPDRAITRNGALDPNVSFIQKPFTPAALIQKVRAVLDAVAP